ncbi:MAG: hypothetical protein HY553_03060, partial [Elusimicrobia bacterium]|nr:hypothetical protein [Elusimicrobiota bacterium]
MQCPNCSAASDDGAVECAACGVVFEKWLRKQAARAAAVEAEAAPAAPGAKAVDASSWAPPVGAAALLAGLTSFFVLSAPSGHAVPPGAVKLSGGFALKVPEGWEATPAECDGASSPCAAAKVTKQADPAAAMAEATGGYPLAVALTLFP